MITLQFSLPPTSPPPPVLAFHVNQTLKSLGAVLGARMPYDLTLLPLLVGLIPAFTFVCRFKC